MPQYGYNNIIIVVTNVIILEFLSARFAHPGAQNIIITKASKVLINFSF